MPGGAYAVLFSGNDQLAGPARHERHPALAVRRDVPDPGAPVGHGDRHADRLRDRRVRPHRGRCDRRRRPQRMGARGRYVLGSSLLAAVAVATARETYDVPLRVIDGRTDPAPRSRSRPPRADRRGRILTNPPRRRHDAALRARAYSSRLYSACVGFESSSSTPRKPRTREVFASWRYIEILGPPGALPAGRFGRERGLTTAGWELPLAGSRLRGRHG
jgi:hypothetical protein